MIEEDLLNAWLKMSVCIKGNRILNELSFNEITILNALNGDDLTFKMILEKTKMLKSQLNRVLNALINKKMVISYANSNDKRSVIYSLNNQNRKVYDDEHKRVLMIMNSIKNTLGEEETKRLALDIERATDIVNKIGGSIWKLVLLQIRLVI